MVCEKEQRGVRWIHWLQQLEFLLQGLVDCNSGFQLFPRDHQWLIQELAWVSKDTVSCFLESTINRVKIQRTFEKRIINLCHPVLNSNSQCTSPAKMTWGFPCKGWPKLGNQKGTSEALGSFENPEALSGMSLSFPDSLASSICPKEGYLWEQDLFQTWSLLHHGVHVDEGIWLQDMLTFIFHCFHHFLSFNQLSGFLMHKPWLPGILLPGEETGAREGSPLVLVFFLR